nr:PACE efflux transporter [Oceanospirillum sediminis]
MSWQGKAVPGGCISGSVNSISESHEQQEIAVRSGWDRVRYVLSFEACLLMIIAPVAAFFLEREATDVGALAVVLSIKAMLMNMIYNYFYDRFDIRRGVVPSQRTGRQRLVHAVGFELSLTLTSLPLVCWWLSVDVLEALIMDAVIMAFIVFYTYVFTLIYDRLFPVIQPGQAQNTENA